MLEQEEKWLPVFGFEGLYEVSDQGRVRRTGQRTSRIPKTLKTLVDKRTGHRKVNLSDINRRQRPVHTLVLEAFRGPRPSGFDARHLNGVPNDNRLINLAWGSRKENCDDKRRHGTIPIGSRHPHAKLHETAVPLIRAAVADGKTIREIAFLFGVTHQTINDVMQGRTWRHV
jgi:hypothetical protein